MLIKLKQTFINKINKLKNTSKLIQAREKISHIYILYETFTGENNVGPSSELLSAVEHLSSMTALLDMADHRTNSNSLEYLLNELGNRKNLLTERDAHAILNFRYIIKEY